MLQPSSILSNPKLYFWILFWSMSRFENHRVHFLLVPASHVTMTSWVKNFCLQNLLNLVSVEREFYADQYLLQNLQLVFVCLWVIDLQRMHHVTMVLRMNLFLSQNPSCYVPLERKFYVDQHSQQNLQLMFVLLGVIEKELAT